MTMTPIIAGPEPPPPGEFVPLPPTEPSPLPPVEPLPVSGTPEPEWGTCVTCVPMPEIVVKITFPELPESPEVPLEGCAEPSWGFPLDWDDDEPLVGDGLEGFVELGSGEYELEVGVDVLGEVLGFVVLVLPSGVGLVCGGFCCGEVVASRLVMRPREEDEMGKSRRPRLSKLSDVSMLEL